MISGGGVNWRLLKPLKWEILTVLRTGQFADAVNLCGESREVKGPSDSMLNAANHSIEAMARFRLGERESARELLAAATSVFSELPAPDGGQPGGFWHDWLMADILYRIRPDETSDPLRVRRQL